MVRAILADHNLAGQVRRLLNQVWLTPEWIEFWNDLGITTEFFKTFGLDPRISDAVLWRFCQEKQFVLLTANRNEDGDDSLNAAILKECIVDSLPVITIGNAKRIGKDRNYTLAVAIKILDYLQDIDRIRGTGRLYVP